MTMEIIIDIDNLTADNIKDFADDMIIISKKYNLEIKWLLPLMHYPGDDDERMPICGMSGQTAEVIDDVSCPKCMECIDERFKNQ